VLTVIVDLIRAEAFLAARFGSDSFDVVPLGKGVWSRAFAFRRMGEDYVIRFAAHFEDFAKDRIAARYASPALPIPRVVQLCWPLD
jgi:hygromycin-B 4-O-kinase